MIGKNAPRPGETAPDFEAVNAWGEPFRLRDALGLGEPVVLVFYRGHW